MQILEPPYQEWVTEEISYIGPVYILDRKDGGFSVLSSLDTAYYLSNWKPGENILARVQESGYEAGETELSPNVGGFFAKSDGGYGYYNSWEGSVILWDDTFQLIEKKELGKGALICGMLQEPESGALLWYGIKDQEAGVWNLEDGTSLLPAGQTLGSVSMQDFRAVYGADGALYLADTQGLWRMHEGNLTESVIFLTGITF